MKKTPIFHRNLLVRLDSIRQDAVLMIGILLDEYEKKHPDARRFSFKPTVASGIVDTALLLFVKKDDEWCVGSQSLDDIPLEWVVELVALLETNKLLTYEF